MSSQRLAWQLRRLRRMSGAEVMWRVRDRVLQAAWARRRVAPGAPPPPSVSGVPRFAALLPSTSADAIPDAARVALLAAADELLAGRWEILGFQRTDLVDPDWFLCPLTGIRAPQSTYAFSIDHRSEAVTGNVKQLWELSRFHHVTVLAAAWRLSGRDELAERAAAHLRSWWAENPFLSGVHWTSGIELGIRLISWVWTRRLLDGWSGVEALFEDNPVAHAQIRAHQEHLAAFRSRGSSANNHVIAEAAGQLAASCAFPWFEQSAKWRESASHVLEQELDHNTFASGVNRELSFDYHGLVLELAVVAAAEAEAAGRPLRDAVWQTIGRMLDAAAATLDVSLRPPRQNDGDDGRAVVLDAPSRNRWASLLALGQAVLGPQSWWPDAEPDVWSSFVGSLITRPIATGARPERRPSHFADAGLSLLRTHPAGGPEIWCRCDGGAHGFLSIAAHAHADALSIEVRHDGVDVLADPGTYCYHGEPRWRTYFRSTLGHNTIEVGGQDQSVSGGPFLWLRHADAHVTDVVEDASGARAWSAEHDGYGRLQPALRHKRRVELDGDAQRLEVVDQLSADAALVRMAWHLGPAVDVTLTGSTAVLAWDAGGERRGAVLELSPELEWSAHRGETDPVLGWYSTGFGAKEPATTLIGAGSSRAGATFRTTLVFRKVAPEAQQKERTSTATMLN